VPADSREVLTRAAPLPTRTERFGPAPHEVYEVYAPPRNEPGRPGVVLVHGGFWRSGYDRTHLRPLATALSAAGWPVALVEYRGTGEDGGDWRRTPDDVRHGLARVRAEGGPFAAPVLAGHSAGGHLVVWLLHQSEGAGVLGAVSLAGCVDLALVARLRLGDGAALALLGAEPEEAPDAMAAIDPVALGPTPGPVVLLHGADDEVVPPEVSTSWLDRVGTPGRDRLVLVDGCGHFGLIDPEHGAYVRVGEAIRSLAGEAVRSLAGEASPSDAGASRVAVQPLDRDDGGEA
jgi:acetyl esterase/lipase